MLSGQVRTHRGAPDRLRGRLSVLASTQGLSLPPRGVQSSAPGRGRSRSRSRGKAPYMACRHRRRAVNVHALALARPLARQRAPVAHLPRDPTANACGTTTDGRHTSAQPRHASRPPRRPALPVFPLCPLRSTVAGAAVVSLRPRLHNNPPRRPGHRPALVPSNTVHRHTRLPSRCQSFWCVLGFTCSPRRLCGRATCRHRRPCRAPRTQRSMRCEHPRHRHHLRRRLPAVPAAHPPPHGASLSREWCSPASVPRRVSRVLGLGRRPDWCPTRRAVLIRRGSLRMARHRQATPPPSKWHSHLLPTALLPCPTRRSPPALLPLPLPRTLGWCRCGGRRPLRLVPVAARQAAQMPSVAPLGVMWKPPVTPVTRPMLGEPPRERPPSDVRSGGASDTTRRLLRTSAAFVAWTASCLVRRCT